MQVHQLQQVIFIISECVSGVVCQRSADQCTAMKQAIPVNGYRERLRRGLCITCINSIHTSHTCIITIMFFSYQRFFLCFTCLTFRIFLTLSHFISPLLLSFSLCLFPQAFCLFHFTFGLPCPVQGGQQSKQKARFSVHKWQTAAFTWDPTWQDRKSCQIGALIDLVWTLLLYLIHHFTSDSPLAGSCLLGLSETRE